MMLPHDKAEPSREELPQTVEEEASDTFVRRLYGEWTAEDQSAFEVRLESDPAFADAYRRVDESWRSLDTHAEAPEVMAYREESIAYARRASAQRWVKPDSDTRRRWPFAAAIVGTAVALATAWQLSPYGYKPGQYRTGIGEQRIVELADHSRITLDAATRLTVRYSNDARVIDLQEGQAQFSVARDPTRPFKVRAGEHTIVALGTVFTVEYVDHKVHVAMMEGKVAVVAQQAAMQNAQPTSSPATSPNSQPPSSAGAAESHHSPLPPSSAAPRSDGAGPIIELSAGEALRVSESGRAIVTPKADLEAATAWREGKVIFRGEPLGEAVRRLNRYSRLRIEIEGESLASRRVSGVFEAGDTQGFVSALQQYYPITVDHPDSSTVRLTMR